MYNAMCEEESFFVKRSDALAAPEISDIVQFQSTLYNKELSK